MAFNPVAFDPNIYRVFTREPLESIVNSRANPNLGHRNVESLRNVRRDEDDKTNTIFWCKVVIAAGTTVLYAIAAVSITASCFYFPSFIALAVISTGMAGYGTYETYNAFKNF
jgi:hypothetical protein